MLIRLRTVTKTDKVLIAGAMLNAGVKARLRAFAGCVRVCFEGEQVDVLRALNDEGYCNNAGLPFTAHSFNQAHEIFVRYNLH